MIYLETNALYKLHNEFSKNLFYNRYAYTSFLAVLEIISGLNPGDYARRKAILLDVKNSGIKIDWDTTRCKITNSFDAIELQDDKYRDDIRELFNLTCLSNDFVGLKEMISRSSISASIEDLAADEVLLTKHDETSALTKKFVTEVDRDQRKTLRSEWYDNSGKPERQNLERLKQFRIEQMAKWIWSHSNPEMSEMDGIKALVESYDGNADYFYLADCFLEMERIFNGREIGRNDYLDISHLLYIDGSHFVSDDRIFKDMQDYVHFPLRSCDDIMHLANNYR